MVKKTLKSAELLYEIEVRYCSDPEVRAGWRRATLPVCIQPLACRHGNGANWHAVWPNPALFDEVVSRVIKEVQQKFNLEHFWPGSSVRVAWLSPQIG